MKIKILVTGGAGFIGSHIVDTYINEGYEVVIADNFSTGRKENLNPKARFYELNILDDSLEEIFKKEKIDILNHHAAQIDVRKSLDDPFFDAKVNILGGIKLLEYSRKYNLKKIIYASTGGAIYGEPKINPVPEEHSIFPLAPYGISKHALEHYIEYYAKIFSLDYTILRYSNVYGPRQDPLGEAGVVAIFIGKILKGENPLIFGDGRQTRDFIFVKDVALVNLISLKKGSKEILNISREKETSVEEIFKEIKLNLKSNLEPVYKSARLGEVYKIALNNKKAKKILNWEPATDLSSGIKQTVEYFKSLQIIF